MQPDGQPRLVGVQRARLLGHELRRLAADRELPVRSQRGRVRHQQPERRRARHRRTAPARAGSHPRSVVRRPAGCSPTTTCTTTTTPTCRRRVRPRPVRSAPGMSVSGARNDTIMNNRFENNGAWGLIVVPYPDSGPPCTGGTQTPGRVHLRRVRDPCPEQLVHEQRLLRQPHQW